MKTKFFMLMMALGMLLAVPSISYAQYTDEDLDYVGGGTNGEDFGPVSLDPEIVWGTLSHNSNTITNTFAFNMGKVVIWIVDEKGNLYISEEIDTAKQKTITIDIAALAAQKYKIICFTPEGQRHATFELYD